VKRIRENAETRMRHYRRITVLLQSEGREVNVKRVHRLYWMQGMPMRFRAGIAPGNVEIGRAALLALSP